MVRYPLCLKTGFQQAGIKKPVHVVDESHVPFPDRHILQSVIVIKEDPVVVSICIQCVEPIRDRSEILIQVLHFFWAGAQKPEKRMCYFQAGGETDRFFQRGCHRFGFHSHHFLPDRDEKTVKGKKQQDIVPVADTVIHPPVCHVYHMLQRFVNLFYGIRILCQMDQQVFKNLIVGFLYKTLG